MMPPVDPVSLQRHVKAKRIGRVSTPNISDEYDFLLTRSTPSCVPSRPAKIRDFGDLNSDQVSQLLRTIYKGKAGILAVQGFVMVSLGDSSFTVRSLIAYIGAVESVSSRSR